MSLRHPVLITTLEEDFRKIGLLQEAAPAAEADVQEDDLEEDEDGDIEEAGRKQHGKTTKKMSAAARRKQKKYRKSGAGKAGLRKAAKLRKKPGWKRKQAKKTKIAKRRGWQESSADSSPDIASLLADVQDIVSSFGKSEVSEEAVQSFANMAIIAEMLSNFFESVASDGDDSEIMEALSEAAATFTELAENAADHARALHQGVLQEDDEELNEVFSEYMGILLDGLELYSDLTEDDDDEDDDSGNE